MFKIREMEVNDKMTDKEKMTKVHIKQYCKKTILHSSTNGLVML